MSSVEAVDEKKLKTLKTHSDKVTINLAVISNVNKKL